MTYKDVIDDVSHPSAISSTNMDWETGAHRLDVQKTKRSKPTPAVSARNGGKVFYQDALTTLFQGDCVTVMDQQLQPESVDIVPTSLPYNLNVKYHMYRDSKPLEEFLAWVNDVCRAIKRVLKPNGSLFLNCGASSRDPWMDVRTLSVASRHFVLQNRFVWVKSISIDDPKANHIRSFGHFRPVCSKAHVNSTFEMVYHFTKTGKVPIDRLALGVPYVDPRNASRWQGKQTTRCRGNCWFIPYDTLTGHSVGIKHPAIFPEELPRRCILLHGHDSRTVVLDPCTGTGSTNVAASRLGLANVGIEIDGEYLKNARQRLRTVTDNAGH